MHKPIIYVCGACRGRAYQDGTRDCDHKTSPIVATITATAFGQGSMCRDDYDTIVTKIINVFSAFFTMKA